MTKNNIITGILLIAAIISVTAHLHQDAEIRRTQNERSKQQLEQLTQRLDRSEVVRDSYHRANDSLLSIIMASSAELKKKDKEIANLRGKYSNITKDSLGILMNQRAASKKQ